MSRMGDLFLTREEAMGDNLPHQDLGECPQFTVELQRCRHGQKEEDEQAFHTMEEAKEYAYTMLTAYGYRVWINGVEYNRKDFKDA